MLVYVFYTRTEHTPGGISGTYTISVCLWFFTTALFDTKKNNTWHPCTAILGNDFQNWAVKQQEQ
jgi:hypothetical protein